MRSRILKAAVDAAADDIEKGKGKGKGLLPGAFGRRSMRLAARETSERHGGVAMQARLLAEQVDPKRPKDGIFRSGADQIKELGRRADHYGASAKRHGRISAYLAARAKRVKKGKGLIRGKSSKMRREAERELASIRAGDAKQPWRAAQAQTGRGERLARAIAALERRTTGGPSHGWKANAPKRSAVYKGKRKAWDLLDDGNAAAGRTGAAISTPNTRRSPLGTFDDHYGRPFMRTAANAAGDGARASSFVSQARRLARQLGVKAKGRG